MLYPITPPWIFKKNQNARFRVSPSPGSPQHLPQQNVNNPLDVNINWDGLIAGSPPTSWARGYKESYYRVTIDTLPNTQGWPASQIYSDFIFYNNKCDGHCGGGCIAGITLLVDDLASSLLEFPVSVAHSLGTTNTQAGSRQFKAEFSYTLIVHLQPGINHIGWVTHAPIHYQAGINHSSRFPVIHFPGLASSCFSNFQLNPATNCYQMTGSPLPSLHLMGNEEEIPSSIAVYNPLGTSMSLSQLAVMGAGPAQFAYGLPLQLGILKGILTKSNEHKWKVGELMLPRGQHTDLPNHSLHLLSLCFP